ncbi:MAG TPA: PEP-CTERM sorting domain-containing protein [Casimicrobiaceae bacterium]
MAQAIRSHGVAASALFAAVAALFSASASGSFYPGHIDPGGTGSVPGFTGDAVFNIPSSCFNEGFQATNTLVGSGGCGNATVYSADIDLYSLSPADPPTPGVVLGTFSLAEIDSWPILGVYVANGALAGVDTGYMGPETGTGAYSSNSFWLQFVSGQCDGFGCPPPGDGIDPAYISMDDITNLSNPGTVTFGPACTDPTNCRVAVVPEPGTLGLILGALGAGWLARRRRKTAS